MSRFAWVASAADISNAALTVQAQAVDPNDNGRLLWDAFCPRRNVDSTKLQTLNPVIYRPAAGRREWNASGRKIDFKTPDKANLAFTPIEATFTIGEEEMQDLAERTLGNEALMRQIIGADIPSRTLGLAEANYRALELDTFEAWAKGQITSMNPVTGATAVASFSFDSGRYQTAGTAWNNGATNAYTELVAWLRDAQSEGMQVAGVMCRQNFALEVQKDAPAFVAGSTRTPTLSQVQQMLAEDLSLSAFSFYINERTVDAYTDGGITTASTKVWAAQRVAAVPQGEQIGYSAFAPVVRAYEISRATPEAKLDVRGQTVYLSTANEGKSLTVACQVNAFPVPDERKMWVMDVGF